MFGHRKNNDVNALLVDMDYATRTNARGFSLVEVVISLVILLVAMLGVFQAFTYAIAYNAGNKTRGEALTVMQKEVELLRSKKFTPAFTDPDLAGGIRTRNVTTTSGSVFSVEDKVDNEPKVDGIQGDTYVCLTPQGAATACAIKEITITVTVQAPTPGWQYAVPAVTVLRRSRGN
jgi:prepilin-type N-terminal cleavage/methylation domain-containing protein